MGSEQMNLREAMQVMKQQAEEMAQKAQREAVAAAEARAAADAQLRQAKDELAEEQRRVAELQVRCRSWLVIDLKRWSFGSTSCVGCCAASGTAHT